MKLVRRDIDDLVEALKNARVPIKEIRKCGSTSPGFWSTNDVIAEAQSARQVVIIEIAQFFSSRCSNFDKEKFLEEAL